MITQEMLEEFLVDKHLTPEQITYVFANTDKLSYENLRKQGFDRGQALYVSKVFIKREK